MVTELFPLHSVEMRLLYYFRWISDCSRYRSLHRNIQHPNTFQNRSPSFEQRTGRFESQFKKTIRCNQRLFNFTENSSFKIDIQQ